MNGDQSSGTDIHVMNWETGWYDLLVFWLLIGSSTSQGQLGLFRLCLRVWDWLGLRFFFLIQYEVGLFLSYMTEYDIIHD